MTTTPDARPATVPTPEMIGRPRCAKAPNQHCLRFGAHYARDDAKESQEANCPRIVLTLPPSPPCRVPAAYAEHQTQLVVSGIRGSA